MLFAAKNFLVLVHQRRNDDVVAFSISFVWHIRTRGGGEMYPQNLLLRILDNLFWPNAPHVVVLDPFLTVPTSTPLCQLSGHQQNVISDVMLSVGGGGHRVCLAWLLAILIWIMDGNLCGNVRMGNKYTTRQIDFDGTVCCNVLSGNNHEIIYK